MGFSDNDDMMDHFGREMINEKNMLKSGELEEAYAYSRRCSQLSQNIHITYVVQVKNLENLLKIQICILFENSSKIIKKVPCTLLVFQ